MRFFTFFSKNRYWSKSQQKCLTCAGRVCLHICLSFFAFDYSWQDSANLCLKSNSTLISLKSDADVTAFGSCLNNFVPSTANIWVIENFNKY